MKRINPKVAPKSQDIKKEIAATVQKEIIEEQSPIKIQRVFTLVGDTRNETHRYIIIRVSGTETNKEAEILVDAICKKMTEMDKEYKKVYKALKNPEVDEENAYTDLIRYEKAEAGKVAIQRQYVGKLMTRAMMALNLR